MHVAITSRLEPVVIIGGEAEIRPPSLAPNYFAMYVSLMNSGSSFSDANT